MLAVSGFAPFDGMALIPLAGIQGAALGTALALVLSIPYLSLVMRWQLGFSYWTEN